MSEETPRKPLKRLGFVQSGTNMAYGAASYVESLYKRVRPLAPSFVEPLAAKVEDSVVATVAPVVAKAQDAGDKLLHFADDKVDYIINTADHALTNGKSSVSYGLSSVRELHENNMKTFSTTTEAYFDSMSKAADWISERLNPVKGVQAATDTLKATIQKAREATDPDVAVKLAADGWNKFASYPPVAKFLQTVEPGTKLSYQAFTRVHDMVVSSPLYRTALDAASGTANFVASTPPYKLGAQYLYPLVQP
eukprot:CAMPEP_0202899842 /NCGR_PEP_ID=MMETSP1392-20130828/8877_1 /ASSEMBLY_ACC=CAM_ASM_000868 /TAXON_ID=225041 /ORGANISM="Chlamydomonas chlamydogama, Strain SAG 11-48b" /LENGTH=250 /DNA_ID=CAMNT_0049586119 /DNA_START=107 /DNA_END=856 /DNA_ORIENTATION=-